jgi:Major Facilitator Superfamily
VIIAIVLVGSRRVHDVPYTGSRGVDIVGAILSAVGIGGVVLGILVWEEGGEAVGALIAAGAVALGSLVWWLTRRKREGKPALIDVGLFASKYLRLGISSQTLQQIALGGMMIALPIYLQMVLEYNAMEAGLSLAPLSLTMFAVALLAGRKAGDRSPSRIIFSGFLLLALGVAVLIPIVPRADSGWAMVVPLMVAGAGLGLLVSQLNNYTLSPNANPNDPPAELTPAASLTRSSSISASPSRVRSCSPRCRWSSPRRRSRATFSRRPSSSRSQKGSSAMPR